MKFQSVVLTKDLWWNGFNPLKGLFEISIPAKIANPVSNLISFNPLKGLFEISIFIQSPTVFCSPVLFQSLKGIIWNFNYRHYFQKGKGGCFNPLKGLFEISMQQKLTSPQFNWFQSLKGIIWNFNSFRGVFSKSL